MAIQFQCSACRQPIEVDDQFANQQAVCPFCRKVITVPESSSLPAESIPEARPSGYAGAGGLQLPPMPPQNDPPSWERPIGDLRPPPPPPGWQQPVGFPPTGAGHPLSGAASLAQRAATTYGNYALICTLLAIAMAAITMFISMSLMFSEMQKITGGLTSQLTPEQLDQLNRAFVTAAQKNPLILGMSIGMSFFGLIGFVLAIVSLRQSTDNWRGWVSLIGSGLFVLCCCGGELLSLMPR